MTDYKEENDALIEEFTDRISDFLIKGDNKDEADKEFEERLFVELGNVDGIDQYLRETMAKDVLRYYQAQSEERRQRIKGTFARTAYFRRKIQKYRE